MLKMNNVLFSAFKYLSLHYEYEYLKKKKLATSWMFISFPKEILHEEEYCHNNIFVNDVYRKPWKRSIPSCNINEEDSVMEGWRRYVSSTDFLEMQPTPLTKKNHIDIVPSSNPCSQIDLEEEGSVSELYEPEKQTHEECWRTNLSNTLEEYLLPKDIAFIDHLAQFGQRLPKLRCLLSRLKTIPIQDPLEDWQKNLPSAEMLFRLNTSVEGNLEPTISLEEFHMLTPSTEKLSLPSTLIFNKCSTQSRTPVSELIMSLQLVPEDVSEEDRGLPTIIFPEDDFIEQNVSQRKFDPCTDETVEQYVYVRSCREYEMEVPIPMPSLKPKYTINKYYIDLKENMLSPTSSIFPRTSTIDFSDPNQDYGTVQQQDKPEHFVAEELKRELTINPDTAIDFTLGEDWTKLGVSLKDSSTIEQLVMDIANTEELNPTEIESFKAIINNRSQRILEEVSLINQKTRIIKYTKQSSCNNSSSVINVSSTQSNVAFINTNAERNTDDIKVVTHGEKTEQPKECLLSLKDTKLRQHPTESKEMSPMSQDSTSQQQSCNQYKSMDGGLCGHHTQVKDNDDLLSNFIALRTTCSLGQSEQKYHANVLLQDKVAQKRRSLSKENIMLNNCISKHMSEHQAIRLCVTPSASQCHAYQVLQTAAEPVLNKLACLEVFACMEWNFTSVSFDCTRFLLREQEKIISNMGKRNDKDLVIFQNAALLHILVTLRDLNLMCSLDATLDYLGKAKQKYESVPGPCLDPIWRKLRIIQFIRDKEKETNPKIIAMFKWIERATMEDEQLKVLILTQMDSNGIAETLNNNCIKTGGKGFRAMGLRPERGDAFLKTKDVLDSLSSYFCLICNNQFIGSDFPWAHFSLIIEYDCTDYWLQMCQNLNVSHMTFKISTPNIMLNSPNQNCRLIPYVLLSSEELINNSELLQILESRYNMTFIEKHSNASLLLLGKKSNFAMITVDVSTVIIIQHLGEIMDAKSAENLILKLVALSVQYSCCWVLLCDKKSNQSGYSLSGEILHGVSLIYSALIPLISKSEDFDIKVLISSRLDEAASLIHRIVEYTLMICKSDPYKWLDRSWLSVQVSEEEKVLLSFPCNNPMVAQLLLSRGSSLHWLLSATLDQLKKLFPEVPSKILKLFTDTTSLHQVRLSTSLQRISKRVPAMKQPANVVSTKEQGPCGRTKSDVLLNEASTTECNGASSSFLFQNNVHTYSTVTKTLKQWTRSTGELEEHLHQSSRLQGTTTHRPLFSGQHSLFHQVSLHPNPVHRSNVQEPHFTINQQNLYVDLLHEQAATNTSTYRSEFNQLLSSGNQNCSFRQTQEAVHNHLFTASSQTDVSHYFHNEIFRKRRLTLRNVMTTEGMPEGDITQLSQEKRRKLTYERVPGRCDGQTRLKFY